MTENHLVFVLTIKITANMRQSLFFFRKVRPVKSLDSIQSSSHSNVTLPSVHV